MLLSIPGKKLLLRSILSCRKFCSDAVFCVLWMSTMYFIAGFGSRPWFEAHQPSRRLYCSVCEEPAPAPYTNGPVPTMFDGLSLLPVAISLAEKLFQMCCGTIATL